MNQITRLFSEELVQALGWTMLHSLWQGLAVALLLTIALALLRRQSPPARYLAGLGALALMTALVLSTFFYVYRGFPLTPASAITAMPTLPEPVAGTEWAAARGAGEETGAWTGELTGRIAWYGRQYFPLLVTVWFFGVCLLTLRMLGELVYIQHLRYNRSRPVSGEWRGRMEKLARELGISRPVRLCESHWINTPLVVGILRPVVLLPVGLVSGLSPREVECVLAHELAHIRRYDYLVNLLQSLAEILLFFNPAVWWISSQIRIEREHCCDDTAISLTGDAVTFVKTLARLEEYRQLFPPLAVGFTGRPGSLLSRIQRVLDSDRPAISPFHFFWSAALLVIILVSVAFHPLPTPSGIDFASSAIVTPWPEEAAVAPETPAAVEELQLPENWGRQLSGSAATDTVPKKEEQFQEEMARLEQEYRARLLALEKMVNDLHLQQQQIEARAEVDQHALEKQMLEVERQAQEIQNRRELENKEREIFLNKIRAKVMDNEVELENLERQLNRELEKENPDREKIRGLEARTDRLVKEKLDLEKEANAWDFKGQTEMLELEREMQMLLNDRMLAGKDRQIELHGQRMQALELEQQAREIQLQMEELNHEFQVKLLELERQRRKGED